ncbi:MAG: hypothetical protein ACP5LM_03430 [Thermoplasmata archaeon]
MKDALYLVYIAIKIVILIFIVFLITFIYPFYESTLIKNIKILRKQFMNHIT